jgi:hypothetical protein
MNDLNDDQVKSRLVYPLDLSMPMPPMPDGRGDRLPRNKWEKGLHLPQGDLGRVGTPHLEVEPGMDYEPATCDHCPISRFTTPISQNHISSHQNDSKDSNSIAWPQPHHLPTKTEFRLHQTQNQCLEITNPITKTY